MASTVSKNSHMTDYERLNLINQFLILKETGSDFYHPEQLDEMIYTLRNGHVSSYHSDVFSVLEPEIPIEISKELDDILYLRHRSLTSLNKIKESIHVDLEDHLRVEISSFGFDGNDKLEAEYIRQAKYIIYKLNDYKGLFDKAEDESEEHFNMHYKTLPIYRKQLERHDEINRPYEEDLTLEDLKYIYLAEVTSR